MPHEPKRLKGRKLKIYLVRMRQLQQALHIYRRDPRAQGDDVQAADRVRVRLDALALARALHENREFQPACTYPTMGKQALLAGSPVVCAELARGRLFAPKIIETVRWWLSDLARGRKNEPVATNTWPAGPGSGKRWAKSSQVAKDWARFQREHRKRIAAGERATLEDLEKAAAGFREWMELLTDHEFLQGIRPQTIHLFRLRYHAVCRAIERRRAQEAKRHAHGADFTAGDSNQREAA